MLHLQVANSYCTQLDRSAAPVQIFQANTPILQGAQQKHFQQSFCGEEKQQNLHISGKTQVGKRRILQSGTLAALDSKTYNGRQHNLSFSTKRERLSGPVVMHW